MTHAEEELLPLGFRFVEKEESAPGCVKKIILSISHLKLQFECDCPAYPHIKSLGCAIHANEAKSGGNFSVDEAKHLTFLLNSNPMMSLPTYKCLLCSTTTIYPHACPVFFSKGVKQISVEQFKLACIADTELSDEQVEVLMKFVVLESEEEVLEFCAILQKYRPNLEKKFTKQITH